MKLDKFKFESLLLPLAAICAFILAIINVQTENLIPRKDAMGLRLMIDPPPPCRPFSPLLFINLIFVWFQGKLSTAMSITVLTLVLLIYGYWYYDSYQIKNLIEIGKIKIKDWYHPFFGLVEANWVHIAVMFLILAMLAFQIKRFIIDSSNSGKSC